MKEQDFKNHARLVPGFHGLAFFAILALFIGSIVNIWNSAKENLYSASLICLTAFILCLLFWYTRSFALRAQDRAIRAEENFRHFILTGKPHDQRLKLGQVIALRFAGDDEFQFFLRLGLIARFEQCNGVVIANIEHLRHAGAGFF